MFSVGGALLSILFISFFIIFLDISNVCSVCPPESDILRRVGNTRFYIIHSNQRGNFVSFHEAFDECTKYGLEMAKIKNMRTFAIVGRELEKIVEKNQLKDTWYWLDAKFNPDIDVYTWGQDGTEEVQYSNFLYRPPRPTGVAGFVNYKGEYHPNHDVDQCITLALPWPGKGDPHGGGVLFGHHTMFDERPCESKQRRHVICESTDSSCKAEVKDPFQFTEDKVDYFEDGNWIFGDRRYVINWKQQTYEDSKAYCETLGLKLFEPEVNETGLIPYIKMWSRHVTTSQFWTGYTFNSIDKAFLNRNNSKIYTGEVWKEKFNEGGLQVRSDKFDTDYCVAMVHSYEFKGQLPCTDQSSPDCTWSFVDYVPANCNNYLGTICQHEDKSSRNGIWNSKFVQDVDVGLKETALTKEFGYIGNFAVLRSKYKQTFGILYCPPGYRMLRATNRKALIPPSSVNESSVTPRRDVVPPNNTYILYDYLETYWVVDHELFNKNADSDCSVSVHDGLPSYNRTIKRVKCTEWHFYACEKASNKSKEYEGSPPQPHPKMVWKEGPQPRVYPLLKPGGNKSEALKGRTMAFGRPRNQNQNPAMARTAKDGHTGAHPGGGNGRFILKTINQTKKAFTLFRLKS